MPGRDDRGREQARRAHLPSQYDDDGGPGCGHPTCQEIACESGCAPVLPRGGGRQRPAAGPSTTTEPGSLAEVNTCPCGEVLEYRGDYRAPGTGQEWHCRNGHSWSRGPAAGFADPSDGAHILRPRWRPYGTDGETRVWIKCR